MNYDLIIVGAGPVGATLALALKDSGLNIALLDARKKGESGRGERSLALSHGSRLIFERLGAWSNLQAIAAEKRTTITPIASVDISERGGMGSMQLHATDIDLPALGYVVGYRALQTALEHKLAEANIPITYDVEVIRTAGAASYAFAEYRTRQEVLAITGRLVAVADGSGNEHRAPLTKIARTRFDYRQVALVAKVWTNAAPRGIAYERFTSAGPMALLPEGGGGGDHFGLVWTGTPEEGARLANLETGKFLIELQESFGVKAGSFERVSERRIFPLSLEFARRVSARRLVVIGNAAQALHPVAGQGFNVGLRDAYELAQELLDVDVSSIGTSQQLNAYARRRRVDRWGSIAFTHGLLRVFGNDSPIIGIVRGLALSTMDSVPLLKKIFTRTMIFGAR